MIHDPIRSAYLFQAIAILVWWIGILTSDSFYTLFELPGMTQAAFMSFALPDIGILILGSLCAAFQDSKVARFIVFGGFWYAALFCLSSSLLLEGGYLGTAAMVVGAAFNIHLCFEEGVVSVNRRSNRKFIFAKAVFQSTIAWVITLVIIPAIITQELRGHILTDEFNWPQGLAIIFFTAFGILGLYCSYIMAFTGLGTPIPMDTPKKLVVSGPYAVVRNPMAIAGLGQGFATSLFLESIWVTIYVILGLIVWNFFIRPIEERELESRFGEEFKTYTDQVKCWIPTRGVN
ncbi:MAG: isoprenylcysteine carboxylmethyltransferase family protein [Opitutales bacterium]|nr:isoprenylcysteine carboxylmethyltransferase family protein [Opitutales bacterium]NRA27506.1 isoprenylcysteine carboxylmethyltransferase family protein [Opitutales bacterium]